jgi:hypothetical protein
MGDAIRGQVFNHKVVKYKKQLDDINTVTALLQAKGLKFADDREMLLLDQPADRRHSFVQDKGRVQSLCPISTTSAK